MLFIVKDASVAMVEGTYSYYHYMQDGTDDKVTPCVYYPRGRISNSVNIMVKTSNSLIANYNDNNSNYNGSIIGMGLCISVIADIVVMVPSPRLHQQTCAQPQSNSAGNVL